MNLKMEVDMGSVLITGASGMLGRRLTAQVLAAAELAGPDGKPQPVTSVIAADVAEPRVKLTDERLTYRVGDISDPAFVRDIVDPRVTSVFHLAGVVSGAAERDFDLGQRVNVDGTVHLLELLRGLESAPRLVFTSSLAVYGGDLPARLSDGQRLTPQTSYGMQKAMGEFLVAEYTRRGWIDGRALRLPTIAIRPGAANAAASSFVSAVVREPLAGRAYACPVDKSVRSPILSPGRCVQNLLHAHELPSEAWGWDRSVTLPSLDVTVAELVDAVRQIGGDDAYKLVTYEPDPFVATIVAGWPQAFDTSRAAELGFTADASVRDIVSAHVEDVRAGW
jgi:nucleoside-diphosphate-sugar epimerase